MTGEAVYIENAGLVLATPFFPHLFKELDLLETGEDGTPRIKDQQAFSRAVHLIQSIVDGDSASPENLLVLNKVLCGGSPDSSVENGIIRSDAEKDMCDGLLHAMLSNWPPLSSGTSVPGLQETFLQRAGRLQFNGDKWDLTVERKTLDVLLDQVGWSFRTILLPWQIQPMYVEW